VDTAVVTGAGRGFGKEIARRLARRGYAVLLTDVDEASARTAAEEIGEPAWAAGLEVTDPEAHRRAAAEAGSRGPLKVWVNNAGILRTRKAWEHPDEEARALIDIDLTGVVWGSRAAVEAMGRNGGHILNLGSMAALGPVPGMALYTAAKHGVVAMSHSINMQECKNGIRSCVFLPGEVATAILDKRPNPVSPEERARMVQPQDCAELILYIALLPKRLVMNEVMLSPTWNRAYVAAIRNLSNL
jgi:NAD(P)-dependent dehydrogenase (short-subunit alcohol dehydrogenase family)